MPDDDHTVKNRDKSHYADRAGKCSALAQAEKRQRQDARHNISVGFDSQQIRITWVEQRHAVSQRSNTGIKELSNSNEDYAERNQDGQ